MTVFTYQRAECPILVSIPHAGVRLCNDMSKRLTPAARHLPDTDWHVDRLYDFLNNTSVGVLRADYSRYVVDLNRAPDNVALYPGQFNSEICPVKTFSGADIYCRGLEPTDAEIGDRIRRIWSPYHACLREELERLRRKFGFAILWDAHSIPSRVPLLFDGELPHLNVGTNDGASCDPELAAAISELLGSADYSIVVNGRFRGGYITRHYGTKSLYGRGEFEVLDRQVGPVAQVTSPGLRHAGPHESPVCQKIERIDLNVRYAVA
jgi:N-formylglutamate deformylase